MAGLNRKLDIDDISTLNISIDQLLASDAIVAVGNAPQQTYDPEFNELAVPLPEVRSLSGLSNGSSRQEAVTENAIDKAYSALDDKLDKTRGRLISMLSVFGYSTWKEDLKELQLERGLDPAADELALIEELVEKKFKSIDLDTKKGIEEFRKRKVGGSMSNLQNSLNEYDNAGGNSYIPGVFRVTYWVGHTQQMEKQVESDKKTVKTFLKQLQKASQDIGNAQKELDETKNKIIERQNLLSLAGEQFEEGVEQSAVNAASRADKLFEDIKGSLNEVNQNLFAKRVNFNGSVEDRFAFNYSREISKLRELNQGWAEVDANYETAIAVIDGTSKACIMVSAAGLGCIAGAAAIPAGASYLTGVLTTTAVGASVTGGIAGTATAASHGGRATMAGLNGQAYDWNAAGNDISNTAFQGLLLGAGGGVVKMFGLGASAVSSSYIVNLGRAGTTSVLFQLPSSAYYGVGDYNTQVRQLESMLNDDVLSDVEKEILESAEEFQSLFSIDEQTGDLYDQSGKKVTVASLSEDNKRILKNKLGAEALSRVVTLCSADTLLNFGTGMFGHAFQSARLNSSMKLLKPKPITPVPTTARSVVSTGVRNTSVAYLNGGSHLFESLQTIAAAEANLQFREGYLGEKITGDMRGRAYSMAFTGQLLGHLQASNGHRENMRTQRVQEQGSAHSTDVLNQRLKENGELKIDDHNSIHLVRGEAPAPSNGKYYISLGNSTADLNLAMQTLPQKIRDIELQIQNKKAGNLVSFHSRKELSQMKSAVERVGKTSSLSDSFLKDLNQELKGLAEQSAMRISDYKPINRNATKAELNEQSLGLREKAKTLINESHANRIRKPVKGTYRKELRKYIAKKFPRLSNALNSIKLPSVIKFPLDFTVEFAKQRAGLFTASHAFLQYGANYGGVVTVFAVGGATLLNSASSGLRSLISFRKANGRNSARAIASRKDMEFLLDYDNALKKIDPSEGLNAKDIKKVKKEIKNANKFLAKNSSNTKFVGKVFKTGLLATGGGIFASTLGSVAFVPALAYLGYQGVSTVFSKSFRSGIRKVDVEQIGNSYKKVVMQGQKGNIKNGLVDLESALKTKMLDSTSGADKLVLKLEKAISDGAPANKIAELESEISISNQKDFHRSLDVLLRDVDETTRAGIINRLAQDSQGYDNPKAEIIRRLNSGASIEDLRNAYKENKIVGSSIKKVVASSSQLQMKKSLMGNLENATKSDVLSHFNSSDRNMSYSNLKNEFLGNPSQGKQGVVDQLKTKAREFEQSSSAELKAQSKVLLDAAKKIEDHFKIRDDSLSIFNSGGTDRAKKVNEIFSDNNLNSNQKLEVLNFIESELNFAMNNKVIDEVKTIVSAQNIKSSSFVGRSLNWITGSKKSLANRAVAGHQVKKDSRGNVKTDSEGRVSFELDVDKQVKKLIDNPEIKATDGVASGQKSYRFVQRAARKSSKLQISKRSDAETIIESLKSDENGLPNNVGITSKMRGLAKKMNSSNNSIEQRIIAEDSLRTELLKNFEIVESHFKSIEGNANAAMEKLSAKVRDGVIARDSRGQNFNKKINEIDKMINRIEKSRDFVNDLKQSKPDDADWGSGYDPAIKTGDFDQQLVSQMTWNREIWFDHSAMRALNQFSNKVYGFFN